MIFKVPSNPNHSIWSLYFFKYTVISVSQDYLSMWLSLGVALGHWKFLWSPVLSLEHIIISGFDSFLKVWSLKRKLGNILWPEVYKDVQGRAAGPSAWNTFIQLFAVALVWIQWRRRFLEISCKCNTLFNTLLQQLWLLDVTKLRFSF